MTGSIETGGRLATLCPCPEFAAAEFVTAEFVIVDDGKGGGDNGFEDCAGVWKPTGV
jgi:hypothetical protein